MLNLLLFLLAAFTPSKIEGKLADHSDQCKRSSSFIDYVRILAAFIKIWVMNTKTLTLKLTTSIGLVLTLPPSASFKHKPYDHKRFFGLR